MTQQAYSIAIAGSTGLVGSELTLALRTLSPEAHLHLLVRRKSSVESQLPHTTEHIVDFARLDALPCRIDAAFCALGTTIADAGSQAAFRAVDFDAVLQFGQIVRQAGATRFGLVSSLGADPKSAIFYNRVKGEIEEALGALGFEHLVVSRPSLLRGQRIKPRTGERLASIVLTAASPLMRGPLRKYRAIDACTVAQVLADVTLHTTEKRTVLESDKMQSLAATR